MNIVLDACVVIAFLRGETGAAVVKDVLTDSQHLCFLHSTNACEIYYDYLRISDHSTAQQVIQDLIDIKISIHSDMDVEFWQVAGHYKAQFRRISLADCFAIAPSQRLGATLLTSDGIAFGIKSFSAWVDVAKSGA